MRLAYFSPLNPQRSGISDYSEELLPHLSQRAEVDLFVAGFRPANESALRDFRVFDYVTDRASLRQLPAYDAVIYHMGNDHRYHAAIYDVMRSSPGVAVFHDFAFQLFFFGMARERGDASIYLDEMEACHGPGARAAAGQAVGLGLRPPHLDAPLSFPLNLRMARAAEGVIVHSEWCRSRLQKIAPSTPVAHVPMHVAPRETAGETTAEAERHRSDGVVRVASFGHITPQKGIERTLRALASLKHEYNFHYTLVGEQGRFFEVRELARSLGLKDRLTVTGYVSLSEFGRRIAETDIAINLREQTAGETSASLCRVMAAGRAAVVSNVGWFSELPDDAVVKIDEDASAGPLLRAYLKRLFDDAGLRARIGANARAYVEARHNVKRTADAYVSFARDVAGARARTRFVRGVAADLARLSVTDRDAEFVRGVAADVAGLAPPHAFAAPVVQEQSDSSRPHSSPPPRDSSDMATAEVTTAPATERAARPATNGRFGKIEGIDYKRGAREYLDKLDEGRRHYLLTKPFDNLARRPAKYAGDGLDDETHRLFCDFANLTRALALPPGSKILDVGCGSGWLSEYLARLGYDVFGIDISPALVETARERLRRVPFPVDHETPPRCRFEAHDAEAAPLAETFDAAVCYDSLHHFEDERAVLGNVSRMLRRGGLLFILEGESPPENSEGERELIDTMREFATLESPFSRDYLKELLRESGFAVVADYVSVNELIDRELVADGRAAIRRPEATYLLCKKVSEPGDAARTRDSRQAEGLRARLTLGEAWQPRVSKGGRICASLTVENTGDALWLAGPAELKGAVTIGLRITDAAGALAFESHGVPPVKRAVAPGESVGVRLDIPAPPAAGAYTLKIDLVAQHVCWFEWRGSVPLALPLDVR
jgi:2-polyprenyl-3-methyl-5-hydroxy-6-metoxy-1,4-benzoquinol methylase/glycosyltransferase involved in cell wall biosynthesis